MRSRVVMPDKTRVGSSDYQDNLRFKQSRDPRVHDDLTRLEGEGGEDRGIVPTRGKAVVLCATGADVKRPDSSEYITV